MGSYWSPEIFSQNFFLNPLYYLTSSQIRLIPLVDDCQSTYLTDFNSYFLKKKKKKKTLFLTAHFHTAHAPISMFFCTTNFPSSQPPKYTLQTEHRHHRGDHLCYYSTLLHLTVHTVKYRWMNLN